MRNIGAPNRNQTRLRLASNPTRNVNLAQNFTIVKHTTVHRVGKLQLRQATTAVSVCSMFNNGNA